MQFEMRSSVQYATHTHTHTIPQITILSGNKTKRMKKKKIKNKYYAAEFYLKKRTDLTKTNTT